MGRLDVSFATMVTTIKQPATLLAALCKCEPFFFLYIYIKCSDQLNYLKYFHYLSRLSLNRCLLISSDSFINVECSIEKSPYTC